MYKIWDRVKNSHYSFTIHSITQKDWEVFYDWVSEKDIIWIIDFKGVENDTFKKTKKQPM